MNIIKFFSVLFLSFYLYQGVCSSLRNPPVMVTRIRAPNTELEKDIKRFNKNAGMVLSKMETAAKQASVQGVCLIAFIPGTDPESWISQMKVIGNLKTNDANLLGIVYSKAAEMADTFKDSGSGIRATLNGECGYQGGLIKPFKQGFIITAFSGGLNAQDLAISKLGLNELEKSFE